MPNEALVKALRSDPMGPQSHQAYLDAVGSPLIPPVGSTLPRSNQGVVPIPPNVQGLANLLVQTGRAPDMATALIQAQQMTQGR